MVIGTYTYRRHKHQNMLIKKKNKKVFYHRCRHRRRCWRKLQRRSNVNKISYKKYNCINKYGPEYNCILPNYRRRWIAKIDIINQSRKYN